MTETTAFSVTFDGKTAYAEAPGVAAYDFGSGDFTVEAWVRTGSGGPVATQSGADESLGAGWGLHVEPDGRLRFVTFADGMSMAAVTVGVPATFDGSWHHVAAVREGVEMVLLFDGVPQTVDVTVQGGAPPFNVTGNLALTIGATGLVGQQSQRKFFTGSVDEVRLWNIALPTWRIDQNIYHVVTQTRDNLVAQYGFDHKDGRDTSGKANDLTFFGAALFDTPAFYFVPEGQPFMAVQVRLMEDYHHDAAAPTAAPSAVRDLRVALSPRNSDGTRRAATLTLTADVDTQVHVQGRTVPIGPTTPASFETNALNQLNAGLQLQADSLVAPVLKVHADFMNADERIVVPLDRQIHHDLSTVTGARLRGGDTPLLDPSDYTEDEADAVARTVGNVMSAAVQHDMQPKDQIIREKGTPFRTLSLSTRRVVNRAAAGAGAGPEVENYLPVEMENPLLVPDSDLIRCHYMAEAGTVERVVIPTFMPDGHFSFDVKARTFTPLTHVEATAAVAARRAAHPALASMATADLAAEDLGAAQSLWDMFVQGLLDVVDIIVSIGSAIIDGVTTTITYVVNGVRKVFDFVVATVAEAADFVVGVFKALAVAVSKIVDFLVALFDWEDILITHRVLRRFLEQSADYGLEVVKDLKTQADAMFDDAKASVDTYFDKAIAALGTRTGGEVAEPVNLAQPASLQADYVNQHVAETKPGSDAPVVKNVPTVAAMETSFAAINAGTEPHVAKLQANSDAVNDFAGAASGTMNEILATFLTAMKLSLDLAIDIAKAVVDAIFDLLIGSYALALGIVTTRIDIPVVTWLYEKVITNDGSTLTALDLIALMGAVPLTVLSKLTQGEAPFTAAFETQFAGMTWQDYGFYQLPSQGARPLGGVRTMELAAVAQGNVDWKTRLAWGQGLMFTGAAMWWFYNVALADLAGEDVLSDSFNSAFFVGIVGGQFLAQVGSYPIHDSYAPSSAAFLERLIWFTQWLPFALDLFNVAVNHWKPAGPKTGTFVRKVEDPLVFGYGVIHALSFIALMIWEEIENSKDPQKTEGDKIGDGIDIFAKMVSNVMSTLPELVGIARLLSNSPEPETKAAAKAAVEGGDGVATLGVPSITLIRTIVSMGRATRFTAR